MTDQLEVIFDEEGFYLDSSVTLKSDLEEFPYEEVFSAVSIKLKRLYILLAMFLISSYGTPLAKRASYLALHISLFGPYGTVNYDYVVTNSINCLLIGSRYIPNSNHC